MIRQSRIPVVTALFSIALLWGCLPSNTIRREGYFRGGVESRRSLVVPRDYDYRQNYHVGADRLKTAIDEWMGTPYCLGGNTHRCVDCSGFVFEVFKKVNGAVLPRNTEAQFKMGRRIDERNLEPGDLVFFHTGGRGVSHVGIYMGDKKFAHASTIGGVMYSSMDEDYFRERYLGARRLF